jgi:hypothetical protein
VLADGIVCLVGPAWVSLAKDFFFFNIFFVLIGCSCSHFNFLYLS